MCLRKWPHVLVDCESVGAMASSVKLVANEGKASCNRDLVVCDRRVPIVIDYVGVLCAGDAVALFFLKRLESTCQVDRGLKAIVLP